MIAGIEDPELHEKAQHTGSGMIGAMLPEAHSLKLSFCSLVSISHLAPLDSLRRLRLDNNLIARIEGLSHLQGLQWLDLSFNQIATVEGLDTLCDLRDLSLYSNQISELTPSSLSGCRKLSILSIGRNRLSDLRSIEVLRPLTDLRCVCLAGNPLCSSVNYLAHLRAYVPQLTYLDYSPLPPAADTAETYHAEEISELKEKEAAEAAEAKKTFEQAKTLSQLRETFLHPTDRLFEVLFSDEPFAVTIVPSYQTLKAELREDISDVVRTVREEVEPRNAQRLDFLAKWNHQRNQIQQANLRKCKSLVGLPTELTDVDKSTDEEKQFLQILHKGGPFIAIPPIPKRRAPVVPNLIHTNDLLGSLMTFSFELKTSLLTGVERLESESGEVTSFISERGADLFKRLDEYHRSFASKVTDAALEELDKFANGTHALAAIASAVNVKGGSSATPSAGGALSASASVAGMDDDRASSAGESGIPDSNTGDSAVDGAGSHVTTESERNALENKQIQTLLNREGMIASVSSFLEAQTALITARDDQMQADLAAWVKEYFKTERQNIDTLYRERVTEIDRLLLHKGIHKPTTSQIPASAPLINDD